MNDDPDSIDNIGHNPADPDNPRRGTAKGPGVRPGARKPGRKPRKQRTPDADGIVRYTPQERREALQRRIAKQVAKHDFARRAVELRRLNKPYHEIAEQMTIERGEPVSTDMVRRAVLNQLRNVDSLQDVRYAELDKLESQAGKIRGYLDDMDARPVQEVDMEAYAKMADSYLKYRERIAKLVGLDAATKTIMSRGDGGAPGQPLDGGSIHIGADGISIRMPGSVSAYEDWQMLEEKGLIDVANQVLELEASTSADSHIGTHLNDKAGLTLRADVDVTPGAERKVTSALDALALLDVESEEVEPE